MNFETIVKKKISYDDLIKIAIQPKPKEALEKTVFDKMSKEEMFALLKNQKGE